MLSIQKFKLYLTSFSFDLAPDMNNWISAATKKKVKDLEIHLDVKRNKRYILPQAVFSSETITSLKLHGCKFNDLGDIKLSNLTKLSIKKANVNVSIIQSFISSCHLIEDLRLIECSCLEYLHISTLPKLTRVEAHECHGLKRVEIRVLNLQTFWYHGKRSIGQCKLDLADCKNLKILTLKDTYMTDELVQDRLSKFPVLEKLVLHECNMLERITIMSRKFKGLSLIRCKNLVEANIDAPNLSSIEYTGDKVPFSSMTISSLHEAKLYFESKSKNNSQLSLEMQKFLQKFDELYGFKLAVCSNKAVTIYEELKEINLTSINDFKLEITKSSTTLKDFVDSFLRASQPKSLSIVTSPSSKFLKEGEKDHTNGKKKISIVVGPWGGNGGTSWDDGSYDGVREVTLVYDWCIDSIHVVYDKNGKPVPAAKRGGNGGNKTAEIKLQFPEEFLVSASGHYCPVIHGGSSVIRSLSFKSNRRTFGPYGVEVGTPFSLSADGGGRIVGFKGRSGWYIDEIGFYLSRPQKSSGIYYRVQQKLKRLASTAPLASKYSQA